MSEELTGKSLAPYIQHTLIDVGLTRARMIQHAEEALTHGFNAVMVAGSAIPYVTEVVRGSGVRVASALDFPTCGVMTSAGKAAEAEALVELGAEEIDCGVQVGWLKDGRYDEFREDIAGVVRAGVPVKVMLELPLLTDDEKEKAVELSIEAGAAFLKNASSGAVETANPDSVKYLVDRAPEGVKVKASGAIKSVTQARELIAAGAVLLGTSAGIEIVTDTADSSTSSY